MSHDIHRVTAFKIVAPYTLELTFDDGTIRRIDFAPVLKGEIYGPLRDRQLFDRARIDPEVQTIVWPNGADFDPATLHDWPEVADEFAAMADRWIEASSSETS